MEYNEDQEIIYSLESELKTLEATIKACKVKIQEIDEQKTKLQNKNKQDFQVTDHALLRYYERFYNLNMENVRDEILYDFNSHSYILKNGNGKLITEKVTYIVRDNKIITLY